MKQILNFQRNIKTLIVISNDIAIYIFSLWISFIIRLEKFYIPTVEHYQKLVIFLILFITISYTFGLYKEVYRYIRANSIFLILKCIIIYTFIFIFFIFFITIDGIPRSIAIIHPLILFFLITLSRIIAASIISDLLKTNEHDGSNLLIYGANNAGYRFISSLDNSNIYNIKGFIDDNSDLDGQKLNNYKIYHSSNMEKVIKKNKITHILLALPFIGLTEKVSIIKKINKFNLKVVTLPSLDDLFLGKIKVNQINDLNINDLLGRVAIEGQNDLLIKNIKLKNILVTGAGGSIGNELCRQILLCKPNKLILLDQSEIGLFEIYNELVQKIENQKDIRIIPILGNICDREFLENLFNQTKIDTIYHAAAYKHVDLVERNPIVGIKNNIFGTINLSDFSKKYNVANFTLISSDKAVNPSNIMGATKRISELILTSPKNKQIATNFSIVRFGNVLNSSGSVVTLFRKQINEGGPILVRDSNATRYFMTIEEASQLVIQAGSMSDDDSVFLLEMGSPVKIIDLAKKIIELSGMTIKDLNNTEGDIEIKITGLKPGEKVHEELYINKNITSTKHPKIFRVNENNSNHIDLEEKLKELQINLLDNRIENVKKIIFDLATQN